MSLNCRYRDLRRAHCGFCDKREDEIQRLIAGPVTLICDECVYLCASILMEAKVQPRTKDAQEIEAWVRRNKLLG